MKKIILNYGSLVFLLLPLLLIFAPWYHNVLSGDFTESFTTISGFEILLADNYRIFISFIFCILLQISANSENKYLFAIIGQIILIAELTIFTSHNYYPIKYVGIYFLRTLYVGYFLVVLFLLVSISINIINFKSNKKSLV